MNLRVNNRGLRGACVLAAALLVGAPAVAKKPTASPTETAPAATPPAATPPAATSPSTDPVQVDPQQVQQELMQIQQRLVAAEQKAMQDPALKTMQTELQQKIDTEMKVVEPTYEAKIERIGEIQTSLQQQQQPADSAAVQKLVAEGMELKQQLEAAQNKVLEDQQVAATVQVFEEKLHQEMLEVEPETDKLVARAEALVAGLRQGRQP